MKQALIATALAVSLAGCAGKTPAPAVKVEYVDRLVEVRVPCPVQAPQRPAPLARPLPETPSGLIDALTAKLLEYAGPGAYADRADAAIATCTKE